MGYPCTKDTPLKIAIRHRQYEAVELLLSNGAKPIIPSVLYVYPDDTHAFELLLRYGADVQTLYGARTLLMHAIWYQNVDVVRLLLEYGSNPSASDKNGRSTISFAIQVENMDIINLLCQYGADLSTKHHNMTLASYVTGGRRFHMMIPLLKWGMPCSWDDIPKCAYKAFTTDELEIIGSYIQ